MKSLFYHHVNYRIPDSEVEVTASLEAVPGPSSLSGTQVIQIPVNLPLPSQLCMTGNLVTNWKRFQRAWNNYEIATRLKDANIPSANKELQTATLLTCIGSDALVALRA